MLTLVTGMSPGQLVERLGSTVLFLAVALPLSWFGGVLMGGAGIHHTLHTYSPLRGIELLALPPAALAASRLGWGAEALAAARASRAGPLLPLLGAALLIAVFWYIVWWWGPHGDQDLYHSYPVQRSIGAALLAGVGYGGMILFPRLTAAMAGAFAGPALFAIVGYILFPSFMEATSNLNTITDAEARLANALTNMFFWGHLAVAIGAVLVLLRWERLRHRPLSHAVWVGLLMLCLAVSGTFNRGYPGV